MNRYLVAVLVTASAVVLRLALAETLGPTSHPFVVLFCAAAVAAAWHGGFRAGLLSTALGSLALVFLFVEPRYSLHIERADDFILLLSYVGASLLGSWFCENLHAARQRTVAAGVEQLAKAAVQDISELLQLALKVGHAAAFTWDIPTNKVRRLHGLSSPLGPTGDVPDTFERVLAKVHPDDRDAFEQRVRQAVERPGREYTNDYRVVGPDGSVRWISDTGRVEFDSNGKPLRLIGLATEITHRKGEEEALRQSRERLRASEERLRLAMAAAATGLWTWDVATNAVTWSEEAYAIHGLRVGEFDGTEAGFFRLVHPEDVDRVRATVRAAVEERTRYGSEFRIVRPNGAVRWVVNLGRATYDGQGRPLSVTGTITDITARKQAEEQLRAAESRFRTLADTAPVLIWQTDESGVTFVSRHYLDFFGQPFEAVAGMGWANFLHPDDHAAYVGAYRSAYERQVGYEFQCRFRRHDGEYRWLQNVGRPHFGPGGTFVGFIGCSADVTGIKQAEDRQRLLSEAAAVLLSTDEPDAMLKGMFAKIAPHFGLDAYFNFMVDDSGTALRPASCAGLPDDMVRTIDRLEFGQAVCGNVALTRRPAYACRIQQSDEPRVQLVKSFGLRMYNCNPLVSGNHLLGTLSFASWTRDELTAEELVFLKTISQYVTAAYERLRLVSRLREADRQKDEFLATLAHELRNPLAPIRNGLQIIMLAGGDAESVEKSLSMMERQVEQITRLLDDLMDLARISQGKIVLQKTRMKLAEAIQNAVDTSHPLIKAQGHEFAMTLTPEPIYVDGDITRLSQVFANLLNNAAKYTDKGGRISLAVERQGSDVVVSVKDNGVGIPAPMLNKVFDIFAQVDRSLEKSQGGLGIGLNIVKRLVEMHDGSIVAESGGQGQGSRFLVRLPVVQTVTPDRPDNNYGVPKAKPARRRILVVDDNVDGADSLAAMLSIMGNETHTAHDGLQAVVVAEAFKPDVILMDIGMPKLNGYEACRRIRGEPWGRNIIIVAQTGWGQEDDKRKSQEAGFNFHMVKPVDPSALEKMLAGLLVSTG